MNPLSVSIVGCGRVAFEFESDPLRRKPASHYGSIMSLPDHFSLHSICDSNIDRLHQISKRFGISKIFTSLNTLFAEHVPDIVVIAASTSAHVNIAQVAINAGVRGIILEKPVSPSLLDARRLLALQQAHSVPVLVFHERRYDPLFVWAHDLIQNKQYGDVLSVHTTLCSASYPAGDIAKPYQLFGGGTLVHDGTHMIDILNYLLPPLKNVSALLRHQHASAATETSLSCTMHRENDIPVYFSVEGTAEYFHFELDIFFTRGRLRIGNGIRELYLTQPARQYSGYHSLFRAPFPEIPADNPFISAYLDLFSAVSQGRGLRSSLLDGVRALEHIYGIYRASTSKGKCVNFPLSILRHPYHNKSFFSGL